MTKSRLHQASRRRHAFPTLAIITYAAITAMAHRVITSSSGISKTTSIRRIGRREVTRKSGWGANVATGK